MTDFVEAFVLGAAFTSDAANNVDDYVDNSTATAASLLESASTLETTETAELMTAVNVGNVEWLVA